MTNVPNNMREMWTDLYILYDSHYNMKNTEEDWNNFWTEATKLYLKYNGNLMLVKFVDAIAEEYGTRMKRGTSNETV